ncbi:acylneuraminate cytidylyltransferase family protein [uncultured Amphritea sp.]|uniref:acylneuraminate cytidylyltransferase family protein n=1 Tax=uncultured Amphritea sp. TaxID=981605 RepID=UPI00262E8DAF|nr:acylneuraminate cytidylyltransferase family protein [uncultured Amphritea sp.]
MLKRTRNSKYLAVIPARGGSKRLPGKNLKLLAGIPLLSWTINAARNSQCIDKIVVSSDDDCILTLAEKEGVVALRRPASISADTSSTVDALIHAVAEEGEGFDHIVLLQPTSPLRNESHIDAAIDYSELKKSPSVVSVCEVDHSPLWENTLPNDNSLKGFIRSDVVGKRSQDLDIYYRLNGAIYIVSIDRLIAENCLIFDESFAFIMDKESSVDIDTIYDFLYAEAMLSYDENK